MSLGPSPDRGRGGVGGLRGALLLHGGKWSWRGLLEDLRPPGTDLDTVPLPEAQQSLSSGMTWPAEVWDVLGFFPPRSEVSPKNPFLEAGWHCRSIMIGSLAPCRNRTLCSEGIHLSRGSPASQLDAGLGPFRLRQGRISSLS